MTALILFIDNPEHASLKPALAAQLAPEASARLLEGAASRLRYLTALFAGEKYLFYSHYPNWNDAWDINVYRKRIQTGEHPAARIREAVADVAEEAPQGIVWLSPGAVGFGTGQVEALAGALDSADIVIGATDGGEVVALAFGPAAYGIELPEDLQSWGSAAPGLRITSVPVPAPPESLADFEKLDIRPE